VPLLAMRYDSVERVEPTPLPPMVTEAMLPRPAATVSSLVPKKESPPRLKPAVMSDSWKLPPTVTAPPNRWRARRHARPVPP
jgi:hypothetical protein